jgi:hypothetical protein
MNDPTKVLDWKAVEKVVEFVKSVVAESKQTQGGNMPVEGENDVGLTPIETVEEIKQFYSSIEKAVSVVNVAGDNQGTLWIEGSFYEGKERLSIGTWLSCQIESTIIPIWVGISDESPGLYMWCPRKSASRAIGIEMPKAGIGRWLYDECEDAYWTSFDEKEKQERDSLKGFKEKVSELYDKEKREWKQNRGKDPDDYIPE